MSPPRGRGGSRPEGSSVGGPREGPSRREAGLRPARPSGEALPGQTPEPPVGEKPEAVPGGKPEAPSGEKAEAPSGENLLGGQAGALAAGKPAPRPPRPSRAPPLPPAA